MNNLNEIPVKSDYKTVSQRSTKKLFCKLKHPLTSLTVLRYDGNKRGDKVHLKIGIRFVRQKWKSKISKNWDNDKEWGFEDVGIKLPFFLKSCKHRHSVQKNENRSTIIEDIKFEPKYQFFKRLIRLFYICSTNLR